MKNTIELNGLYKLSCFDFSENTDFVLSDDFVPIGWLDASIPEDARTTMRKNGLISGHFYGKNLDNERWIDEKNWIYHKRFYVDNSINISGKKNILHFDGIDTLSEIYLNGEKLGDTANMFIPHEFDVSDRLNYGSTNILVVKIISPIKSIEHIDRTGLYPQEDTGRLLLRKSQMNYGWDFCGHCLTTGLWKGVSIVSVDSDLLGDVFLNTESIGNTAEISINASVLSYGNAAASSILRVSFFDSGKLSASTELNITENAVGKISVPSPKLWWPRPYGEPFLYDVQITLEQGGGVLDSRTLRFGIRTVELVQEPISAGGRNFVVKVNGRELFVRGANWVPLNSVYADIKDKDYDSFINRAVDANLSMLRIWGGGIYESEHFFDLCDSHGIMIMQDFMLACGVLPQEQWYLDQVAEEVDIIARHYRNRTCIVIWSGDNELDEAYRWYDILPQFKTNKVNRIAVKNAIEKADPTRPFLVSSPCSPFEDEEGGDDPNSPLQGDMHIYLTRFQPESEHYYRKLREFVPRFMSEYGFSSLPCLDTVKKFNFLGNKMDITLNPWLGELPEFYTPEIKDDLNQLILATQFTHAQALKYGIEYMRSYKGVCGGLLYWKFNDPYAPNRENMLFTGMMSSIDFFGKPKMVYYYSKRAYEDVILAFRETLDGKVSVCFCNETEKAYNGSLKVSFVDFDGNEHPIVNQPATINSDSADVLFVFDERDWLPKALEGYIKAEFNGDNISLVNRYTPAEIQKMFHLSLPSSGLTAELAIDGDTLLLSIDCKKYTQDVALGILDVDAYYSDNFFQMDAGEHREIRISIDDFNSLANKCLTVKAQNSEQITFDLNPFIY